MTPQQAAFETMMRLTGIEPIGVHAWKHQPRNLRNDWQMTVAAAVAEERELSAQTAEWEHAHGTNGIGIAAAIRAGHRRVD
jgi:hypothetical protein